MQVLIKKLRLLCLILVCLSPLLGLKAMQGPAKKPKVMVVPSDALLNRLGLLSASDDMGEINYIQDYKRAFFNSDVKATISKFGEMMSERGFPTVMLEHQLKKVQGKGLEVPVDIRIDLNYTLRQVGPRKILYFELSGIDNYSSKQIVAASGESAPAIGVSLVALLQEAVLDKIDPFNAQLMRHFEKLNQYGRESNLVVSAENGYDLDDVADFIDSWLEHNCKRSAYTIDEQDESLMRVSQAMMPLFDHKGKALSAYSFYRPLKKELKRRGLNCKLRPKGLGEAHLIISNP